MHQVERPFWGFGLFGSASSLGVHRQESGIKHGAISENSWQPACGLQMLNGNKTPPLNQPFHLLKPFGKSKSMSRSDRFPSKPTGENKLILKQMEEPEELDVGLSFGESASLPLRRFEQGPSRSFRINPRISLGPGLFFSGCHVQPTRANKNWIGQMAVAQNLTGGVTQVLVHVSTYQGSFWCRFFEPQPNEARSAECCKPKECL